MNTTINLCAVIPVYRHGKTLAAVCGKLAESGIPSIIVDDGNEQETKADIEAVRKTVSGSHVVTLPQNGGKGAAVIAGLRAANELKFTHAVQVDADGQHDLSGLMQFISEAGKNPHAVICGYPQYDESVPSSRKNGRKITTVWVSIETLSKDIVDAMCGFRIYPVQETCRVINRGYIGKRMTFDIEILVRLHWKGLQMVFLPVSVIYPEGGISNFNMLTDNIAISVMHTRLFFGMLLRSPLLLSRKLIRAHGGRA